MFQPFTESFPQFVCYQFTTDDYNYLMESHQLTEREVCEMVPGRVYTNSYNGNYPGCGDCRCCEGISHSFSDSLAFAA